MSIGVLEVEDVNQFFRMFDDKDVAETVIAIGQLNARSSDGQIVTMEVVVTHRGVYNDCDTIMSFSKNMGSCPIPFEAMKEGGRKEKEEYDARKKMMDALVKETNNLKNNLILKFESKGFPVIKGVWSR